jgi:sugar lactone lactonase YvrE
VRRLAALVIVIMAAAAGGCGPPAQSCVGVCKAPSLTELARVAGQPGGPGSVDGVGAAAHFADPWTFAGDGAGKLWLIDGSIVRAIDEASGAVTTLAGSYGAVGGVDGIGAAAQFFQPGGMVLVGGTIYLCDTENHAVRTIDPASGTVATYAGALGQGATGDGDRATARFREPEGITFDGSGSLYVADTDNATIRRIVLATGAVTTLAGTAGVVGNADGVGAAASFHAPKMIASDGAGGHLYVVDTGNASIRVVATADGTVTTRATFAVTPTGVAVDGAGLIATLGDNRVARIDAAGTVTTLAGAAGPGAFADGAAADARFNRPAGLWIEGGHVLIADDGNYAVRSVALADGATTTVYSASSAGASDGAAGDARFFAPQGLATDGAAAYLADTNNHTIRRVDLGSGAVTTIAGAVGQASYADGTAGDARFNTPLGVALDDSGKRLFVVDSGNRSLRAIDLASGAVTTLPINGAPGSMFARFNAPSGLARAGGVLFVSDSADHVIVAVELATNLVTPVAGSARVAGATDGVGTKARFNAPAGLVADGSGALYVADVLNDAVRKVDLKSGTVSTVAGVLGIGGADDGAATSAHFNGPVSLAVDGLGHLFVADQLNALVRRVDLAPAQVTTLIGTVGLPGVRLGPLPAQLGPAAAIALTPEGQLLVISENSLLIAR